jgi:hypothetical protein
MGVKGRMRRVRERVGDGRSGGDDGGIISESCGGGEEFGSSSSYSQRRFRVAIGEESATMSESIVSLGVVEVGAAKASLDAGVGVDGGGWKSGRFWEAEVLAALMNFGVEREAGVDDGAAWVNRGCRGGCWEFTGCFDGSRSVLEGVMKRGV